MIDYNFRDYLVDNVFSGRYNRNIYGWETLFECIRFYNPWMYPLIKKSLVPFEFENNIPIAQYTSFGGMALSKEKVVEVLNGAKVILKGKVGGIIVGLGKGVLTLLEPVVKPILLITIPGKDYTANRLEDMTLLVNSSYIELNPVIKSVVSQMIRDVQGDVIMTSNINKYLTGSIKVPIIHTLGERKVITEQFIDNLLETENSVIL